MAARRWILGVSVVLVMVAGAWSVRGEERSMGTQPVWIEGETLSFVERPGGRVAVGALGPVDGPLVVLVPGLGDTRGQYRVLAPQLAQAGWRVLAMDLRGHGDSDATFTDVSAEAVSGDLLAVVKSTGRPAVLVGNSFAGRVVAYAAEKAPDQVRGLVLIAPFSRDRTLPWGMATAMRVMFARPWGAWAWGGYYKSLYPTRPPADLATYTDRLTKNLGEKGRLESTVSIIVTSDTGVDARVSKVTAPALVVMGSKDPDFKDPADEARLVAGLVKGSVAMVEGAGHYPHVEFPEVANAAIESFLAALPKENR